MLWQLFQLLIMFACGCFGIWVTENLPDLQRTATLLFVGIGAVLAYGLTNILSWLMDLRREAIARRAGL